MQRKRGGTRREKVPGRREGVLVDSDTVLHLYDTATRSVRELALREPGKVSIYLCGPTVYGPPHLGHGRATLVYDIMRRYLEWTGLDVRLARIASDAVVGLHSAFGRQAVVVPAHRVEHRLAGHALIARDGVCVGVAEHVADVQ